MHPIPKSLISGPYRRSRVYFDKQDGSSPMRSPGPSPKNPSSRVSSASRLPGLRGHLRGKVGGALLHALAQHVAREAAHLRSIRR